MKKLTLCVVGAVLVLLFAVGEANAANFNFVADDVIGVMKDKVLDGPRGQQFGNVNIADLTDMVGKNKKKNDGSPVVLLIVSTLVVAGIIVIYYMRKKSDSMVMSNKKRALRIANKIGLVIVIIGFCMPVACDMNGFQIATEVTEGSMTFALWGLFAFACFGALLCAVLLAGKQIGVLWDWLATLGATGCATVALVAGKVDFDVLQSGAYVILVGLGLSLLFQISASLMTET